mgnify:CR=1 FL=1
MKKCDCYNTRNISSLVVCHCGASHWKLQEEGYCMGTKEQDSCKCSGDMSKCDFYESVRSRASSEKELLPLHALINQVMDEVGRLELNGWSSEEEKRALIIKKLSYIYYNLKNKNI